MKDNPFDHLNPAMIDNFLAQLSKMKFIKLELYLKPDEVKEVIDFIEKLQEGKIDK